MYVYICVCWYVCVCMCMLVCMYACMCMLVCMYVYRVGVNIKFPYRTLAYRLLTVPYFLKLLGNALLTVPDYFAGCDAILLLYAIRI